MQCSDTEETEDSRPNSAHRKLQEEEHIVDPTSDCVKIGRTLGTGSSCQVKVIKFENGSKYAMKQVYNFEKCKK